MTRDMTRLEIENNYAFLRATLEEPNPVDFAIEINQKLLDELASLKAENTKYHRIILEERQLRRENENALNNIIGKFRTENERLKEEAKGINNLLEALIKLQDDKAELVEVLAVIKGDYSRFNHRLSDANYYRIESLLSKHEAK